MLPYWAFEGLAGEAGAVDAAEDGGLGRADVVAVEAGDRERLQDVEFDQFHEFVERCWSRVEAIRKWER